MVSVFKEPQSRSLVSRTTIPIYQINQDIFESARRKGSLAG